MNTHTETSDKAMLDYLRREGAATISALVTEMGVTATAIRQRLQRLTADGLIERPGRTEGSWPAEPSLFADRKGRASAGTNFGDMAVVLWEEIKSVPDPSIRRGLLKRIADRFVAKYRGSVSGETLGERMTSLAGSDERARGAV